MTASTLDLAAVRLAQIPPFCAGTGAVVTEGEVDGDGIAMCPACGRWREAYPIPDDGLRRHTIEAHGPVLPRRTPGASLHLFEAVL